MSSTTGFLAFAVHWGCLRVVAELEALLDDVGRGAHLDASLEERGHEVVDAALLERYFDEYVLAGFLPPPRRGRWPARGASEAMDVPDLTRLESLLRQRFADDSLVVKGVTLCARGSDHSIVGELTSWRHRGRTGLFHHRLDLAGRDGDRTVDVVTKIKPADRALIEVAAVADICDRRLGRTLRRHRDRIGLRGAHLRELALYAEPDERLRRHTPVCYGTWQDESREEWGLVLERLDGRVLMDATEDPEVWTRARVDAALDGLAQIQAVWCGREAHLASRPWIGHVATTESMVAMTPLWRALASHATPYLGEWTDASVVRRQRALVESVGDWWPSLEASPRTLIHNDFSPRNVIRDAGGSPRLCAYDWRLATLGAPQCDLAHFTLLRARSRRVPRRDRAPCRATSRGAGRSRRHFPGPRRLGSGFPRRAGGSADQPADVLRADPPRQAVAILAAYRKDLVAAPRPIRRREGQLIMKAPIHDLHVGNLLTSTVRWRPRWWRWRAGRVRPARPSRPSRAVGWALAALLDTFDGRFARCFERTSRQRRVGCEIDSLVDVCAFGMGPVVVLEAVSPPGICAFGMGPVVVLEAVSPPGSGLQAPVWWASAFAYLGAVVTRLGFYNVKRTTSASSGSQRPRRRWSAPRTSSRRIRRRPGSCPRCSPGAASR